MKKFFEGRIKRLNYFGASLMLGLIYLVIGILLSMTFKTSTAGLETSKVLVIVLTFVLLFFQISLSARRLHDFNISGYFSLIFLISPITQLFDFNLTIISYIFLLILFFVKGTNGSNKYGEIDQKRSTFKVIFP